VIPRADSAHWLAASVALFFGLVLMSEVIVGTPVFRRRAWRAYLFPTLALSSGVFLWVIAVFSTFSTIHLLAHGLWAEAAMIAGGVRLAIVRGKLKSSYWSLVTAAALIASGAAFLVHEPNPWLYSRAAFLHHAIGWMLLVAGLFPIGEALRPRWPLWRAGFALTFIVLAVFLFADRNNAPIFGHFAGIVG
jgi:uncharacterized membrane protein